MTKKKNRQRKVKTLQKQHLAFKPADQSDEAATGDAILKADGVEAVEIADEELAKGITNSDSGNESPTNLAKDDDDWKDHLIANFKAEARKAWSYYQACMLERYHWFLEKRRNTVADMYGDMISAACLHLTNEALTVKVNELQGKMRKELEEIDADERVGNAVFADNIAKLDAGEPMECLQPLDSHVTADQIEKFIAKYSQREKSTGITHLKPGRIHHEEFADHLTMAYTADMMESFTGSIDSRDSGCIASPRRSRLLSDIWKPDEKELASSFASVDMYTDQSAESQTALFPDKKYEPLPMPKNQHRLEDDDSAIQAVVYMKDEPAPSEVPLNLNVDHQCQNSFFDLRNLGQLPFEYGRDLHNRAQDLGTDHGFPELQDKDSLMSPQQSGFTEVSTTGGETVVLAVENKILQSEQRETSSADNDAKKATNKNDSVVKFTDKKSFGEKEQQLVSEINFAWSEDLDSKTEDADDQSPSAPQPITTSGTKKPLSFASILASPSKSDSLGVKRPLNDVKPVNSNEKVLFSTKKSTPKFPNSSSLNKTSICWTFEKQKTCPWGNECIFAHGKKQLRPMPKWYKQDDSSLKPKGEESSSHAEPCKDHYCYWRRQFLLRKTTVCKLWLSGRCGASIEKCPYAHGKADLKALPKYEMCRKFLTGKCGLKTTECVYAHSKKELRKKPSARAGSEGSGQSTGSPVVRRLRTISERATSDESDWSTVERHGRRVRTVSGTSVQSWDSLPATACDLEEFDWQAWNSQSEVPQDEELDDDWESDECAICAVGFSDGNPRFLLDCKHDNFHQQCISRWVNEKDPSCPICRCSAVVVQDE